MSTIHEINAAIRAGKLSVNAGRARLRLPPLCNQPTSVTKPGRPWVWQIAALTRDTARRSRRLFG